MAWTIAWFGLGIVSVLVAIVTADVNDPPFREESYEEDTNPAYAVVAALFGPFVAAYALFRWVAISSRRAKEAKKSVAEEMERELSEARKQVEDLLRRRV